MPHAASTENKGFSAPIPAHHTRSKLDQMQIGMLLIRRAWVGLAQTDAKSIPASVSLEIEIF